MRVILGDDRATAAKLEDSWSFLEHALQKEQPRPPTQDRPRPG